MTCPSTGLSVLCSYTNRVTGHGSRPFARRALDRSRSRRLSSFAFRKIDSEKYAYGYCARCHCHLRLHRRRHKRRRDQGPAWDCRREELPGGLRACPCQVCLRHVDRRGDRTTAVASRPRSPRFCAAQSSGRRRRCESRGGSGGNIRSTAHSCCAHLGTRAERASRSIGRPCSGVQRLACACKRCGGPV